MAFIRIEKKKSGNYLRVMESYREGGKSKHRIVASLGKESDYTPEMLQRMGEKLYLLGGGKLEDLLGQDTVELGRFNYGFSQVTDKAMRHYELDKYLGQYCKRRKIQFDLFNTVKLLVCERLEDPISKLQGFHYQDEYIGIESVSLQHIYRSLDHLDNISDELQYYIFQQGRTLFSQKLDVVFYDVTTFYFDSETEDGFRAKGFGKDGKVGKTQVVFGMLIDKAKNPIGYQVYAGNQYEGHTFEDALKRLKEKYQIDNVIVVADRGMLSKDNIEHVNNNNYEFIVGERLKSLPKGVKEKLLDLSNYKHTWQYTKSGESISLKYFVYHHNNRKIITTYSEKRANKDRHDREERLAKTEKLLKNPSALQNKSRRFFIKQNGENNYCLDEDKIEEAKKYDGFMSISTNNEELPVPLVLDHYRHLFQIEQTFRSFKSHLEVRPMFHWTEKRIKGHLCLCYLSHVINHFILQTINDQKHKISEQALRRALSKMQVSHIRQQQDEFYLRSNNEEENIKQIIKKMKLKTLPNVISKNQIMNYL